MRTLLILPFLLGLGRILLPQIIRTVVPVVASNVITRFGAGVQGTVGAFLSGPDEEEEEEEEEEE